jgi:hypothetical protein
MFSRLRRLPWRVIIPWTLFVLTAAAAVTFGIQWNDYRVAEERRDEVEEAASGFVTALTNFSASTIDVNATRIKSFAVGDFAEEVDTFFGEEAIAAIKEAEAESTGQIESLFIQEITDDEASVFGVVSETITNSVATDPRTDILRLEVGMIKTSSGWKVNRVDVFQAPGAGAPLPAP